ncbi:DUF4422 domain-containing protein [Pelagovum pacificum]|uniref:DUF4422 domain-containing protein n=1 Tax=Pelagovum pacificum TaxID=2588711 RepID=A0A5C5G918_9RHOB|nr:DUF4422 domain-containing protein [Pelagovum pacificum]QQA45094.1 DUF4422 domain-containing protein [Pelagovum pacificum]TNY30532.1 DUF4422 domain-containing protein [Pelagovum pacificum]
MTATIHTAYHKPAPMLSSASVRPVHVGRAVAAAPLPGMAGDDTGDHISDRNATYCELTALYHAWKQGDDSTHTGLMHYRRVLDFTDSYRSGQAEIFLDRFDIPEWLDATEAWLAAEGEAWDLVVPRLHTMPASVEANYAADHVAADFERMRQVMAAHHPDWLPAFEKMAKQPGIRLGNVALMRRDLFDEYCALLFDVLARIEAQTDLSGRDAHQSRYLGFLSERLFTAWVMEKQAQGARVREVHLLNLARATVTPWIADDRLNGPEHVNVAFSADPNYLPHAAAMVRSLAEHADPARRYNLFFLEADNDPATLETFSAMLAPWPNVTLTMIPVGDRFATAYGSKTRAVAGQTNASYNRFLLFDLLPGLDRLLYLDVDMILRGDVARIFDAELGGAPLGAVRDHLMTRVLTGPAPTTAPEAPELGTYLRETVRLDEDGIRDYFNAGLLLLNFAAMDVKATGAALLEEARSTRYLFRDQDILNRHFAGQVRLLPAEFNVLNTRDSLYSAVPDALRAEAMAAKADPLLVHYADRACKPWLEEDVLWGDLYWSALAGTPFLQAVKSGELVARPSTSERLTGWGRRMAERYPRLRPAMIGARRALNRLRGG